MAEPVHCPACAPPRSAGALIPGGRIRQPDGSGIFTWPPAKTTVPQAAREYALTWPVTVRRGRFGMYSAHTEPDGAAAVAGL